MLDALTKHRFGLASLASKASRVRAQQRMRAPPRTTQILQSIPTDHLSTQTRTVAVLVAATAAAAAVHLAMHARAAQAVRRQCRERLPLLRLQLAHRPPLGLQQRVSSTLLLLLLLLAAAAVVPAPAKVAAVLLQKVAVIWKATQLRTAPFPLALCLAPPVESAVLDSATLYRKRNMLQTNH